MSCSLPEENILAVGTINPRADVATQAHVTVRISSPEPTPDRLLEEGHMRALGRRVRGTPHLRRFRDPPPAIDRLEGFHRGATWLYRRVLVPVRTKEAEIPAWLYVVGNRWTGSFKELTSGIWH